MSEINLSPEAKTAIYKIIHQSQGISPQEIADVLVIHTRAFLTIQTQIWKRISQALKTWKQ